jgi:5,5'-dehydrodivanillate O-demethylase
MENERHTDFEHTGPNTLAGRLLRRSWQPVFLSEELPTGRAMPIRIMNEELTVYRGEDGVARIVGGRCAHRGLVMHVGKVEKNCIRCRYHGWKYDASGQCVEQPAEPNSFAAKARIGGYPTEEYFGLIWVYLGEGTPPELPRWPELEPYARIHIVELRKWNYFHDLENTVDDVHQRWVHGDGIYQDEGLKDELPKITTEETTFGLTQTSAFSTGLTRKLMVFMPNTLFFNSGAGLLRGFKSFLWNVPVDDTSHKMYFLFVAAHLSPEQGAQIAQQVREKWHELLTRSTSVEEVARSVLRGETRWEDIERRPDVALIEDSVVLLGQGVLPDRSKNRLGSSDAALILLRKLYAREMSALHEGRPLTGFQKPAVLPAL